MLQENTIKTDVLVIGGGIAGCFAAIKAKEYDIDVTLVDKGYVSKSGCTAVAGGYFMVFHQEWGHSLDKWIEQVSIVGEYMNDREWTEIILRDSYERYKDLLSWGVEFRKDNGNLHINHRGVLQSINMLRRKYTPVMRKKVIDVGVKIIDKIMVTDFVKQNDRIVGAMGFHTIRGDLYVFKSKATVISAGAGSFKPAGLPISVLTGDAEAMAYRAGTEITGKEFPDRHTTMVDCPAWRGHGMTMAAFSQYTNAEDKTLDRTSTIVNMDYEVHCGRGPIFWDLDAAAPEDIKAMLNHQQITGTKMEVERAGLDVRRGGKIPLVGGAYAGASVHQTEGIWPVDKKCATSVAGLFAAGDCCGTRQIGVVYPGTGFALTGSAVTGYRAGLGAAEHAVNMNRPIAANGESAKLKQSVFIPMSRKGGFSPKWVTQILQNNMIPYFICSIKEGKRLQAALTIVEFIRDHLVPKLIAKDAHELRLAHETKNMVLNAEMILRTSIFRTESRGTHYREDYPRRDDSNWLVWVKLKEEQGKMQLYKENIPKEWWPDLSKSYEERYPLRYPNE